MEQMYVVWVKHDAGWRPNAPCSFTEALDIQHYESVECNHEVRMVQRHHVTQEDICEGRQTMRLDVDISGVVQMLLIDDVCNGDFMTTISRLSRQQWRKWQSVTIADVDTEGEDHDGSQVGKWLPTRHR